ncbi:MAG TPA: 2-oxoacid:acceptor oxidoreductase family protein [Actinomycetota bacterium]|nr:2-oxoacid:acceptor oxidoreductase family protein [Actinomycetota bacterium]
MERELLLTGIGGQGVQLAARVIATAAIAEGRSVQLFGSYGGMMRGGNTDATIVISDGPVEAPPTVGHAWSAIVMHDQFAGPIYSKLIDGSIVVVNSDVCSSRPDPSHSTVVELHANEIADGIGNRLAASMVLVGAYAAATGLVALDTLTGAISESLPSYRQKTVEVNVAAVRGGYEAASRDLAIAWPSEVRA